MIDLGKIADLVLLMIDGSFGFEMETFEFLNVLQVPFRLLLDCRRTASLACWAW